MKKLTTLQTKEAPPHTSHEILLICANLTCLENLVLLRHIDIDGVRLLMNSYVQLDNLNLCDVETKLSHRRMEDDV